MKRVLWWLILGTRGGVNRARIIKILNERPYNAHQIAELLELNYRTIRHHMKILEDIDVIQSISGAL
jgi:predicted ArsR family transcriptional regulator